MSEMAQLIMKFVDAGGMRLIETMDRVTKAAGVTEKAVTTAQDKMAASDAKLAREAKKNAEERAKLALYEINEKNKYAKQDIEFFNRYLAEKDRRAAQSSANDSRRVAAETRARATQQKQAVADDIATGRASLSRQKSENDALLRDWLQAKDARTRSRREEASQERRDASARATQRRKDIADDIALGRKALAEQKALAAQSVPSATGGTVQVGGVQGLGLTLSTLRQIYDVGQQAARVVADVVNEAAKWEKYKVALTDIEGSAGAAGRALDTLYELAKRPGIGLLEAQQVYLQFRALGIEGDKATRMIEAFSNAVALSSGGATEFQRINYQLVQMISKGKVLEEDLRIMRNSMPRLTVLMQQAFGATTAAGIREAGINAEGFVAGIVREMEKLPTATQTLESRIENAGTAWSRFKASLVDTDTVGRFVDLWTGALEEVTAVIDKAGKTTKQDAARAAVYTDKDKSLSGALAGQQGIRNDAVIRAMQSGSLAPMGFRAEGSELTGYHADVQRQEAMDAAVAQAEADKAKLQVEANKKKAAAARKAADDAERALRESPSAKAGAQMLQRGSGLVSAYKKQDEDRISAVEQQQLDHDKLVEDWRKQQEEKKKLHLEASEQYRSTMATEQENALFALDSERDRVLEHMVASEEQKLEIKRRYGEKRVALEQRFQREERAALLTSLSGTTSAMSGFFGNLAAMELQFNEQNTREHAKWVAISQTLAIVSATLSMYQGMADALRTGSTVPEKIAGVGVVAAAGGQIIGAITAMNAAKVGKGFFDKGGSIGRGEWGIAGENGPEIVEGPARITSTRDTARKGQGGMNVQVYNYAGAKVETKQNKDGSLAVIIREAVNATVNEMTASVATGRGDFNRALQTTFGLKRGG